MALKLFSLNFCEFAVFAFFLFLGSRKILIGLINL